MVAMDYAKGSREEVQLLTFSLDNVSYGVDVHQVREVKNFEGVTPVPYAPPYVKGVTNLRGEVIPVIDLRKRFGVNDKKANEDTGIMIIVQDKHPVGIMVDSVMEVLTISKRNIDSDAHGLITGGSDAVVGIAKHDKDLIILLDLMKIVTKKEIDNISDTEKEKQAQLQREQQINPPIAT
ncbi:MAG: chemotaxis protein CheW [Candidatus Bathyarchaeia archaeon]